VVADAAIDPETLEDLNEVEIVETALLTFQATIRARGWDEEGLVFIVPNILTEEEALVDLRDLPELR
jgi:hypothetical protein